MRKHQSARTPGHSVEAAGEKDRGLERDKSDKREDRGAQRERNTQGKGWRDGEIKAKRDKEP